MHFTIEQCAIVILAAGSSSRLGRPKQLLFYQGKSLLKHAIDAALQTDIYPVVIVTGANNEAIKNEIRHTGAIISNNEQWQQGMASSIRCGLEAVKKIKPAMEGVIFMVCDQPHVTSSVLGSLLIVQRETGLPLVASSYNGTEGTPALFHKTFFAELMELTGDMGAKKLLNRHKEIVATTEFPLGVIDIDTSSDYQALVL